MREWANRQPSRDSRLYTGEKFIGPLELGSATVHFVSNGYDLDVEVVYLTNSATGAMNGQTLLADLHLDLTRPVAAVRGGPEPFSRARPRV